MFGKLSLRMLVVVVIVLVLSAWAGAALAAPAYQVTPGDLDISKLLLELAALSGVGALVSFAINVLKRFGIVTDGTAPTWVTGFNIILLAALFALKVFAPQVDVLQLDKFAATIAQIGLLILGLLSQTAGARAAHYLVKGSAWIGTSYSRSRTRSA